MQPFKYMTDVASTNTLRPSMSKVLSIIPAPFSNCMEYEKPEHPPPTTPMRKPEGTGVCWPIISFTLATAFVVRVTGAAFLVTSLVISGTVVVAIRISLALKLFDYNRCRYPRRNLGFFGETAFITLLAVRCGVTPEGRIFGFCNRFRTQGFIRCRSWPTGI